jgi:hypothetical protein
MKGVYGKEGDIYALGHLIYMCSQFTEKKEDG